MLCSLKANAQGAMHTGLLRLLSVTIFSMFNDVFGYPSGLMKKGDVLVWACPLFPQACVRRKAIECHLARDHDLGRDRSLGRASLLAFEVLGVWPPLAGGLGYVLSSIGREHHLPDSSQRGP